MFTSFIKTDAENLGSIQYINFCPTVGLTGRMFYNDAGTLLEAFSFVSGFESFFMEIQKDNGVFTEEQSDEDAGSIWKTSIKGFIPGDIEAVRIDLEKMTRYKYVVWVQDNDGRQRIAGTVENGLRFTYKFSTTNRVSGLKGYDVEFYGELSKPALLVPVS